MYIEGQPVLAYCYIKKNGDDKNVCYLTRNNLLVKKDNRISSFTNESITGLSFEHKLFLFPLVVGGIITPFSVHALLNTYLSPWLLLTGACLGLLLMYYGWEGSSTMTVKTKVKDYDFFISSASANLKAFAEYVQHYISDDVNARRFYFAISKAQWESAKQTGTLALSQPVRLFSWREARTQTTDSQNITLAIDPTEGKVQINFIETEEKKKLHPILTGNISAVDIQEIEP